MTKKRILVLGAYGLIGAEIVRKLRNEGHDVVGLVRSPRMAKRLLPGVDFVGADIAKLLSPEDWRSLIAGFDTVVNASGALQTGLRDNLAAVQEAALVALIRACEDSRVRVFVQISAPGASETASTQFFRTKGAADTALLSSSLGWIIFKPGLVIARNAYGGTVLIRALSGMPFVQPIVLAAARLQTVCVNDVADAVAVVLTGRIAMNADYDLVEDQSHSLLEIMCAFRRWMGLSDVPVLRLPLWLGLVIAKLADMAGWLGWRSPLRSTALKVLRDDVLGNPSPWREVSGKRVSSLHETLSKTPSTSQDRAYATVQLLTPFVIGLLSAFFIASGAIAMMNSAAAAAVLQNSVGAELARVMVAGGAILDILLGAAILFRPFAKVAAGLMIALSGAYLLAGSFLTPHLWLDPLGVFVKVFPVIGLALCAMLIIEER